MPYYRRWKKWTLISKIGFVSGITTILMTLIQLSIWSIGDKKDLPPSEKLIVDKYKTEVVIDRIEIINFQKFKEPYVVMILKNNSEVTARNVNVSFVSESGELFIAPDGVREMWRPKSLAIKSKEEAYIPVAPISEYTKEIFGSNPDAKLLEFRFPNEEEVPFSLDRKVCGEDPKVILCSYEARQRSTVVNISYESIFDEKITNLQQWFNIFLLGEPNILRQNG